MDYQQLLTIIRTQKSGDKAWFLSLLDDDAQKLYEDEHIQAVMQMLRLVRIRPYKKKIQTSLDEIKRLESDHDNSAENYPKIKALLADIETYKQKMDEYRCFFDEPYFARMDLIDNVEGYNSYYIGKKGDERLEIVDWRAPISRRYYQKSCSFFKINEYEYKTVLRRAIRAQSGKFIDFKNEYLSLKDHLSQAEIGGRDEENILDPFLKEIIQKRKEETAVKDIIETIQEKQYEIITRPEKSKFILQGCAGSGKTMVMLHRLSYLLYNNEEIKPHDVLIITPSNSFNAFIDELASVLDLERVRTMTVYDYFLQLLKSEKIDLSDKIDRTQKQSPDYLEYVYSNRFVADVKKKTDKVFDNLYGLFTGDECQEFIANIIDETKTQLLAYESIKNASMRVRRCVLGEIKERKEGGLYYTRPFRELMNCILDINDFLGGTLKSPNAKRADYFYRQLMSFYKSSVFTFRHTERIVAEAVDSLNALRTELQKEIAEMRRFHQKIGGVEVYMYADRIARREELLKEVDKIQEKVLLIGESNTAFSEFYSYLKGEKTFVELGRSEDFVDVVRYFYRETVKKFKAKYGMVSKSMYVSDAYALCLICSLLGKKLSPTFAYVFVDEAQDVSPCEYALLQTLNEKASFNVFGDIEQNVTPWRGVKNWQETFDGYEIYTLNQNYRNTNQIVDYVSKKLRLNMQPIGFDGPSIQTLSPKQVSGFFKEKKGLKAIICSEKNMQKYYKKAYNLLSEKGKISPKKINLMTVYESKGLEFSSVLVDPDGMQKNEEYIAYTRALQNLAVVKE